MTKFILHGGRTRIDNESNKNFFHEITKDIQDGGNILLSFLVYSDDSDDIETQFEIHKKWISDNSDGKEFTYVLADEEKLFEQLKKADGVYFHGGDTDKLMGIVKNIPDFEVMLGEKTTAGSSAGAYILSTYYHSASGSIEKGLGILPVRTICHYQSPDFNAREEAVEKMKEYPNNLELVVLRDSEWKVFEK